VAATEFHADGVYSFEGGKSSAEDLIAYYTGLVDAYPLSRSRTRSPRTTGTAGSR
jgi:enolase